MKVDEHGELVSLSEQPGIRTSEDVDKLLAAKIAVQKEVTEIPKNGFNKDNGYWYSTHADILGVLRPLLLTNNLDPVFSEMEDVVHGSFQSPRGKAMRSIQITVVLRLYHISGQWLESRCVAESADWGDKGVWKAKTGAMKYLLKYMFNLATADAEPEIESPGKGRSSSAQNRRTNPQQKTRSDRISDAQQGRLVGIFISRCEKLKLAKPDWPGLNAIVKSCGFKGKKEITKAGYEEVCKLAAEYDPKKVKEAS